MDLDEMDLNLRENGWMVRETGDGPVPGFVLFAGSFGSMTPATRRQLVDILLDHQGRHTWLELMYI